MKKYQVLLFDVDGTLTDAQGRVSESYAHALRYIAQFVPLYLLHLPLWRTGYRGEHAEVPPSEQKLLAEVRAW